MKLLEFFKQFLTYIKGIFRRDSNMSDGKIFHKGKEYGGSDGAVYTAGTSIEIENNTISHSDNTTADTAQGSNGPLNFGDSFDVPSITYNAQGHIISKGKTTLTLPNSPSVQGYLPLTGGEMTGDIDFINSEDSSKKVQMHLTNQEPRIIVESLPMRITTWYDSLTLESRSQPNQQGQIVDQIWLNSVDSNIQLSAFKGDININSTRDANRGGAISIQGSNGLSITGNGALTTLQGNNGLSIIGNSVLTTLQGNNGVNITANGAPMNLATGGQNISAVANGGSLSLAANGGTVSISSTGDATFESTIPTSVTTIKGKGKINIMSTGDGHQSTDGIDLIAADGKIHIAANRNSQHTVGGLVEIASHDKLLLKSYSDENGAGTISLYADEGVNINGYKGGITLHGGNDGNDHIGYVTVQHGLAVTEKDSSEKVASTAIVHNIINNKYGITENSGDLYFKTNKITIVNTTNTKRVSFTIDELLLLKEIIQKGPDSNQNYVGRTTGLVDGITENVMGRAQEVED